MGLPSKASLPFLLLGPQFTQNTPPLLAHWSHPSLVRKKSPLRIGGKGVTLAEPRALSSFIDAFQNCCPLPARIQEIVVETPALAAERER